MFTYICASQKKWTNREDAIKSYVLHVGLWYVHHPYAYTYTDRKVIFSSKNNLSTFRLNAPVTIRAKVKVRTSVAIYTNALLRIYVLGGQRLVWGLFLPPCLITAVQQPGTSSPPSWLKRSSSGVICRASFTNSSCHILVEALLLGCHMQGLFHQQLLSYLALLETCLSVCFWIWVLIG